MTIYDLIGNVYKGLADIENAIMAFLSTHEFFDFYLHTKKNTLILFLDGELYLSIRFDKHGSDFVIKEII